MINIVQAVILTTAEILCCKIFSETFLNVRFPEKRVTCSMVLGLSIILATVIASIQIDNYFIKSTFALGVFIFFISIYFKAGVMQILFCAGGFYGILLSIDKIMLWLIPVIFQNQYETFAEKPVKVTILALLFKVVLFLCVIALNRRFKKENNSQLTSKWEWAKFIYFPIFTILVMIFMVMGNNYYEQSFEFIAVGLTIGNFLMFHIIKDITRKERKISEMMVMQERISNQSKMYHQLADNYEEQKMQIHDFRNQIGCIQGLLESKEVEKAVNYIVKLNHSWIDEMNYIETNHAIVNAVLNQKYKQARKKKIPIIFLLNNMEQLTMGEEEIVTLLANLLDNAIEAAQQLETGDRSIKFQMLLEEKKLTVCVRNPSVTELQKIDGRVVSTKVDRENHGIGLLNIQQVIHKYQGEYIQSCHNGFFTSTIIINNI